MSRLYIIAVGVAVFVCIGVGMLIKYLLRKYDSVHIDRDSLLSFLVALLVIVVLAIIIGLVISLGYPAGESIINALTK